MTDAPRGPRVSTRTFTSGAIVVALLLAIVVSLWASSNPDGLEYVAESTGFSGAATDHPLAGGPLADYAVAGVDNALLSNLVVGVVGVGVTFLLAYLIGRFTRRSGD